ncbi:sensor domain-containing diguanylate cyclase [Actinoplanes sp. NPDC023714]|uniref:sensor domain-containing diguanylate cyclase n=1 Tax=Actinoplanes sp. NPDC023714 TaxID=3154322 RepID=UPI00340E9F98
MLAIVDFLLLDGFARLSTTILAAGTGLLLAVAALWRRDWADGLGYVPVVNGVCQVALTGEIHWTTTLMLTLVCVAAAVPHRRTFAGATVLGCAGWAAAVIWVPSLRMTDLAYWVVQLSIAALVAAILHEALRRRQWQLRQARDEIAAVADRFGSLFHASPSGVAIADERDVIVAVNQAFCDLVGLPENKLVGFSCAAFASAGPSAPSGSAAFAAPAPSSPAASSPLSDLSGPAPSGGGSASGGFERRLERPDGSVRWVWSAVGRSADSVLIQLQDVTDRHLAEAAVRDSDRLLAAVSQAARRIRTGEDARSTIIDAVRELAEADSVSLMEPLNAQALVVTGAAGAQVLGTRIPLDGSSMTARVYGDGQPVFLADATRDPRVSPSLLALVDGRSMMWQPVIADGVVLAVLVVGWTRSVDSVSDHRARAVAMLADETALALEHERLLRRLEQMAFTDTLTGLPNRRAWQSRLATLFAQDCPLAVAIADLDRFKRYNDTHGHLLGDELLQRTALAFAGELHGDDVIARWGGEEFVIALPGRTTASAFEVLERVRRATPDAETCSIGYAVWDGAESAERLLERADAALYQAKNNGRDMVKAAESPAVVRS